MGTERGEYKVQILRTYHDERNAGKWTIKQAIMAATAAPTMFPKYEKKGSGMVYMDVAVHGLCNPSEVLYARCAEVKRKGSHRREGLFLDIGTGAQKCNVNFGRLPKFLNTARKQAREKFTDTETPNRAAVATLCNGDEEIYHRLNVPIPPEMGTVKSHHYTKIDELGGLAEKWCGGAGQARLQEIATRVVDVLTGRYERNTLPDFHRKRSYEVCNGHNFADPEAGAGVCIFR